MSDRQPTLRPRCDAAIVFAVALEADAFADRATGVTTLDTGNATIHEGLVADRRVAWCVGGVGGERAARATRLLLLGHRPQIVVSAGFAGGLDPSATRGAVVRPGRVIREHAEPPLQLATGAGRAAPMTILTVDRIVGTAAGKRSLFAATAAAVVDMETYAVAAEAHAAGVRCGAIRVVSDDAGQDLPREVAALARPQSALRRFGAALGAIGRRPAAALDMWRLYEHAVVDGKTLAAALVAFLSELPAGAPEGT